MEMCFTAAEKYIERQSVHTLAALATPGWTKAVVGTAAAMVIETARPMCAKQLIVEVMLLTALCSKHGRKSLLPEYTLVLLQVPTAVRKQIQQQLGTISNTVIKAAKANGRASHQALP